MSSETAEFDLGNFPKEPDVDEIEKDLTNAIKALDKHGWRRGWGSANNGICILNAVNTGRLGAPRPDTHRTPKKVIEYIYKAIYPESSTKGRYKDDLAGEVMAWNDRHPDQGWRGAQDKADVKNVLRNAIKLRRKDLEKS